MSVNEKKKSLQYAEVARSAHFDDSQTVMPESVLQRSFTSSHMNANGLYGTTRISSFPPCFSYAKSAAIKQRSHRYFYFTIYPALLTFSINKCLFGYCKCTERKLSEFIKEQIKICNSSQTIKIRVINNICLGVCCLH